MRKMRNTLLRVTVKKDEGKTRTKKAGTSLNMYYDFAKNQITQKNMSATRVLQQRKAAEKRRHFFLKLPLSAWLKNKNKINDYCSQRQN